MDELLDTLYNKIEKTLLDVGNKIFIPISGGLDSRVVAGIFNKKRKIDLSYVYFNIDKDIRHVQYSAKIANQLDIEKYYVIPISNKEIDMNFEKISSWNLPKNEVFTAFTKLNKLVDLKEYTLCIPHGLEYITGIHVTQFDLIYKSKNKKIDSWYLNEWRQFEKRWVEKYKIFFKNIITTWNDDLVSFCLNLPLKHRCNQGLYRKMIMKYLPEISSIPREDMNFRIDQGDFLYTLNRFIYSCLKLLR